MLFVFLFPTVSDPDILTWINQYSLPLNDCQNMVGQIMAARIMCVGQPLNILSRTKVTFFRQKDSKGTLKVVEENHMALIQKAWSPSPLSPKIWGLSLVPLPSFYNGKDSG